MKFTHKLFFSITALLTAAFMLFGSFMLFSYFNRMLERETEQGKRENLLFQTIYDMVYQNMEKYGAEFAGIQAGNSATQRMTGQNGTECLILETDGTITLEGSLKLPQDEIRSLAEEMIRTMDPGADQVYGVRRVGTCYYLLSIITDQATDSADTVYLGILKDLSGIYEERSNMMRQYGIALAGLLVIGGLAAFLLSRYLTRPIEQLNRTAGRIAGGDFEKRAVYQGTDEIGELSRSFNRMTDRLVRQMEEKELEAKQKEDFTAAFAHELKTPLTSIVAYLTMLEDHPDMPEEERKAYTHIALEKSIRLGELINEFFDITRYNLQNIELEPVEIDLTMMLEQLADELYGVLQEKKLTCEVDVEEELMIYGDPDKLARVFDNILRNAIAYCYADTEIRIEAKMKDGDIEITFTNAGDKIPGDMLQTIFEKFYRVDGSRSTGTGGAGLGLAIAKQIVELHGGRILAKSDDNRTQFVVTLPSKEKTEQKEGSEDEVHTHRRLAFRGKAGRGKRVQSK